MRSHIPVARGIPNGKVPCQTQQGAGHRAAHGSLTPGATYRPAGGS